MDIDPVCGMAVSRSDVSGKSEYQDKPYYFCSPACKERFDADPARYVISKRKADDTFEETT
jgi:P-type Cu+ transporter